MILVGMGNDKPIKQMPAGRNKVRIWHLNAGAASTPPPILLESNTAIHHQPAAIVAIEVEVHAYLATPSERQEPGGLRPWLHRYHA